MFPSVAQPQGEGVEGVKVLAVVVDVGGVDGVVDISHFEVEGVGRKVDVAIGVGRLGVDAEGYVGGSFGKVGCGEGGATIGVGTSVGVADGVFDKDEGEVAVAGGKGGAEDCALDATGADVPSVVTLVVDVVGKEAVGEGVGPGGEGFDEWEGDGVLGCGWKGEQRQEEGEETEGAFHGGLG